MVIPVLMTASLLGLAGPASAHNTLVDSDPKDGTSTATGPASITLTFDQPVQAAASVNSVVVVGPDGGHWESGDVSVVDTRVTTAVNPLGPAGEYRIGYRVLSNDGHPVTGQIEFTLTASGAGPSTGTRPDPSADPSASDPAASGSEDGGGLPTLVWITGAVVLLAGGLVLALRLGRDSNR
jgi:methionine-rich copper-binding protein CopC